MPLQYQGYSADKTHFVSLNSLEMITSAQNLFQLVLIPNIATFHHFFGTNYIKQMW